ncbi:hypothetical protein CLIM01_11692 [Colletotrichum limetticola]|uniref:Uncharacterized protein n=1 Tax=Colletotrichum limetticola TaxID=1209924 RepID=A0ABQ9PGJ1_9PEZI|nr:hypothetical protein CLIM01_11692 [Colletotrichum limetticola]
MNGAVRHGFVIYQKFRTRIAMIYWVRMSKSLQNSG